MSNQRLTVIVTGGRNYNDVERVYQMLDRIHDIRPIEIVVTGACPFGGADLLAENWAKSREVNYLGIPAKFKTGDGKSEGPKRNRWILNNTNPNIVLAFPGGRGTASMVREAEKREIWTVDSATGGRVNVRKLMGLDADHDEKE